MRDSVLLAEPAAHVDVEELRGPAGAVLQLLGQRGEELQACGRELAAETELGRRADEERLRLGRVEPGELRAVAALEAIAARGTAHRDDRNSRRGERLGVALHRPLRDLEPLGELLRGQLSPGLEDEEKGDETTCTHVDQRSA